jgi:hypothetical protein
MWSSACRRGASAIFVGRKNQAYLTRRPEKEEGEAASKALLPGVCPRSELLI